MSKVEHIQEKVKLDRIKEVIKNNWKPLTIGVVLTTVTLVVTKKLTMRYMHIEGTATFIHKANLEEGPLYQVFNIYAHGLKNQGPSWMVKCMENGRLYRSQEHAAKMMNISESLLSTHLNGKLENVGGYHFERQGIAA